MGTVIGGVVLGGFFGVMGGVEVVSVGHVSVVTGGVVIAGFVILRGGLVMFGGEFVVVGCLGMMIGAVFRHRNLSVGELGALRPAL